MQYCRIISLDNNNSVKLTSSREDNSTTNDSMVMKIAHAQLHMYSIIMYKFQSSTCKGVREKLRTKLCPRTGGRTAMAIPVYPPPPTLLWRYKSKCYLWQKTFLEKEKLLVTSNFFFSHADFHSYKSLLRQNAALCGNGLN